MIQNMNSPTGDHAAPETQASRAAPGRDCTRINTGDLMGARSEVIIVHEGREYTLRITRNRKLILTA